MSFHYDLPSDENNLAVDRTPVSSRLNTGFGYLFRESEPILSRPSSPWNPEYNNWDEERLNPSTTRLRSVTLVSNGVPTGEKSIAQPTRAFPRDLDPNIPTYLS